MSFQVALAGNPNSGKTTLFNELTGAKQHVGNWPGVTVEQKTGTYKKDKTIKIVDLPGIYSLSPYSAEEIVARNYIVNERPSALINIVDATNIERNLYLTLQLIETGIPMVVALNMMDEVEAAGTKINIPELSKLLGVKVVPIVARNAKGIKELMDVAVETATAGKATEGLSVFNDEAVERIEEISKLLSDKEERTKVWKAVKLLENDDIIGEELGEAVKKKVSEIVSKADKVLNGDAEAAIADQRYQFIGKLMEKTVQKQTGKDGEHKLTTSDKIDKVLTNRILALPIFAVVMYLLFSITFGEGPLGIGVFLQTIVVDFWDGPFTDTVMGFFETAGASEWALSLIGDGILAGVGGVVSFLPQILVLFLLMSVMEDSGYMARVAFVMDKIFRKFGLSGKSFIPLLMGFGCSVPALMASRTLESEKERRFTMMVTPFMSCGAKLPIYLMFVATLFTDSNQTLVVYSIYILGLVVAILSAIILNKTLFKGGSSNFIMELPQYRIPTIRSVIIHAWEKVKGFAVKAGTIILGSTILIWFLANFNFQGMCEMEDSILASLGNGIKIIFAPLGFGNWRAAVGVVTGWIAKENIVATFGVLFGAGDEIIEGAMEGANALPGISEVFTKVSAFSYMAFNLLCMPCFAAVGALKREMGSWKWTGIAVAFQMIVAWIVAFLIYNIGSLMF